jgi:Polyketide cyclase / dehydrase and lipid transport
MKPGYRRWHVVRSTELPASATALWDVVGGFFNIHTWHPDIVATEFASDQLSVSAIRRVLTFPGRPKTVEQLISMDNAGMAYTYKWVEGAWGEAVEDYVASIRVVPTDMDRSSLMQWASTFLFTEDAVSQFYENGFRSLRERFSGQRVDAIG